MAAPAHVRGHVLNAAIRAYEIYEQSGTDGADEAMAILNACLTENPDDVDALSLAGRILYDAGHFGHSQVLLSQALRLKPTHSAAWQDLGRSAHMRNKTEFASRCFANALRITGDRFTAYNNLLLMNNTLGRPEKALEIAPIAKFLCGTQDEAQALNSNGAIACLMLRKWAAGWANYDGMLVPGQFRKELFYHVDGEQLPRWDGTPGGEVIVYGEQGLGDEIMFASMIPDMIAQGTTPIIHCDRRLTGLFKRSFACPVYGGRGKKTGTAWIKDHRPKAAIAIGSLGRYFRNKEEDFPRAAYLVADPEKRAMCRALLNQWPGRKIGLAWSGGSKKTRAFDRSLTLEELAPIIGIPNATFVSLEYAGGEPSDERVKHVPFLTQSQDYDDTAALVAELDGIVSVTTAVALLAGAVGTPVHVLVPTHPTWHWLEEGEMPWFPLKLYRRVGNDWTTTIDLLAEELHGD